jgi:amphiphysin
MNHFNDTAETEKWEKLMTTGIKPSPRDKHSAVLWGKKVVIFGGFGPATGAGEFSEDSEDEEDQSIKFTWFNDVYVFDTDSNSWEAPNISLIGGPVPRAAHSATIYKDSMIIFGGKDSKARNQVRS